MLYRWMKHKDAGNHENSRAMAGSRNDRQTPTLGAPHIAPTSESEEAAHVHLMPVESER